MDPIREAYLKYLETILIKSDESIEPTYSQIEFVTDRDINGRVIIYSPLLGEKYRLWSYYSHVSPVAKYGHVIAQKQHNYDFGTEAYVVNIKTGEKHKLWDNHYYRIAGDNKIIGDFKEINPFMMDFKGKLIGETQLKIPEKERKKMPRKEPIKDAEREGFFKTIYRYDDEVFDVRPILDYDGNIICYRDGQIYLYDKIHKEMKELCSVDDFDYTHNGIIIRDKRYMLFKGRMVDVTDFPNVDDYYINPELDIIYELSEFKAVYENSPYYKATLKLQKEKQQKLIEQMEEEKRKKELIEEAEKQEKKKADLKQDIKDTEKEILTLYQKYLELIETYEALGDDNPFLHKKVIPITENLLFIEVGDHKEINPFFLDNHLLRYADLSLIDFSGVKLDHIECLAYTNANLDPQTVYNKDLSFSDLRGIEHTMDNFDGVNMEGTIVDQDKLDFVSNLSEETVINKKKADSSMNYEEAKSALTDNKNK